MKLTLGIFSGAVKALHPKLLGESAGVQSLNQKPGRGDLRSWRQPLEVATVGADRQTIYRFGRDVKSDAEYWFSWSAVVHAVRGYNAEDTTERTYFTGDGAPKWTDNTIAGTVGALPLATRPLGVPAPVSAAILTPSGGTSANTETRYVTYTYTTTKGDESAPAPAAEVVCKTDDTIDVASIAAPPAGYDIDRIRIYCTITGQAGAADFFFQKEVGSGVSSTSFSTPLLAADVLTTDGWLPPPADLRYLTPMWNGMLAGISGNGVRVCASYAAYAWPIGNEFVPADVKPVALGRYGEQNLLVLTTGDPLHITGTSPESLDMQPLNGQACSAPRAVVSFGHGVVWPCEDGLCYFGQAGAKLVTQGLLTRDDWQAMNPAGMVAGQYEGAYLCFYTDAGAVRRGFLIDPLNPTGLFFLEAGYSALFFDRLQDALFVLDGTSIKKWDAAEEMMTATYVSKVYVRPPANFAWAKVTADDYPVTVTVDAGPFKEDALTKLVASNPTVLSANGDRVRFTLTAQDAEPFRPSSGFSPTEWQLTVQTDHPVQLVELATSAQELDR